MQFVNKGSTECRTQLPMFLVLFSKKYREKELKKNTSEQLRLGTTIEFDDERKRVFRWRGLSNSLRCAGFWAGTSVRAVFSNSLRCARPSSQRGTLFPWHNRDVRNNCPSLGRGATRGSVACDDNAKLALFATTGALAPQRSAVRPQQRCGGS